MLFCKNNKLTAFFIRKLGKSCAFCGINKLCGAGAKLFSLWSKKKKLFSKIIRRRFRFYKSFFRKLLYTGIDCLLA